MNPRSARVSPFWVSLAVVTGLYLLFLLGLLGSMATYTTRGALWQSIHTEEIQYSIWLSVFTCTMSALFALLLAVPVGYLLSRGRFPGKPLLDAALDIPIVLPPMVVGLCLLIFFQTPVGRFIEGRDVYVQLVPGKNIFPTGRDIEEQQRPPGEGETRPKPRGVTFGPFRSPVPITFTYTVLGVVLAQFVIGAAFAVRTMRGVFDHLSSRPEDVAMTLGCSRGRAFWLVTLPSARRGMFAAFSIAWARSLGEFGPILVFAGATRMKTEVLPTSVFLELSVGRLEAAVAVSVVMVVLAMLVLISVRIVGERL